MIHEDGTMDVTVDGKPSRRPYSVQAEAPFGQRYEPELRDGEEVIRAIGDDPQTARIVTVRAPEPLRLEPCCEDERRSMAGGCLNCGDPCF